MHLGYFRECCGANQFNTVVVSNFDGKVYFMGPTQFLVADSFQFGVWQKISVEIDYALQQAKVFINDNLVKDQIPTWPKSVTHPCCGTQPFLLRQLGVAHNNGSPIYVDDFSVFELGAGQPSSCSQGELVKLDNITNTPGTQEVTASWSPDGTKLVFAEGCDYTCGGAGLSLSIMNNDGSGRAPLHPSVSGTNLCIPDWSPDGMKILYVRDSVGGGNIYVMDINKTYDNQLTFDPGLKRNPRWSPDGQKIVFFKGDYYTWQTRNIWIMNADGSSQTSITTGNNGDHDPSWHPNPNDPRIIFTRCLNNTGYCQIYTMNSNGDPSSISMLTSDTGHKGVPSWSPNGKYIAYIKNNDLWIMDSNNTWQKQITNLGRVQFPRWNPTGDIIVLSSGSGCCDQDTYLAYLKICKNSISNTSPAVMWIGLKNSDDQGTQFDLRTELYLNDVLVSEGQTLCITGVTRNPSYAREATVPFGPVSNGAYKPGDVLSLRVLTRIGTNPDGSKCSGPGGSHNNAVGLRLYYDAPTRALKFGAAISPDPMQDLFLHSSGSTYFLDEAAPTGAVKYKDSAGVNFNNGNPWKEIGTWRMVLE